MTIHQSPEPGWYSNGVDQMQWWDGETWGPRAPQQPTPAILNPATTKSVGTAYVLLIFLGGFGAHRFYLNEIGYALWFLIPAVFGILFSMKEVAQGQGLGFSLLFYAVIWFLQLIDLFILGRDVKLYNEQIVKKGH